MPGKNGASPAPTTDKEAVDELFPADENIKPLLLDEVAETTTPFLPSPESGWAKTLDQPLDKSAVKQRKGAGGTMLDYLEWHYVTRQLNHIFGYGNWSTEITETKFFGEEAGKAPIGVMVRMRLAVTFPGLEEYTGAKYWKSASFENTGYAPNKTGSPEMFEMALGAATQTAFKRCATALGDQFGLSLYEKDKSEEEATGTANPTTSSSSRPATSPSSNSSPAPAASPLQYLGQSSFECQDCGREVTGYASAKTGKSYTTQDLWDMSIKQTGGLYCFNCKMKHSKR